MLVINPEAGPSRLALSLDSEPSRSSRKGKRNTLRGRRRVKCSCFLLTSCLPLAGAAATSTSNGKRRTGSNVPPFYSFNGSDWVESGDWSLNGRYGAEYKASTPDHEMLQDNLPSSLVTSTSTSRTSNPTARITPLTLYTPFANGKRDRTSFYAVPLIIVLSVILFSVLVIFLFGTLFYWKKKRAYRKRRRAIESDEGYGEQGSDPEKVEKLEEGDFKLTKRHIKLFFKTKAMTRFKRHRSEFIVARTTALDDSNSLRRRRSRRPTPTATPPESAYQTENEEEAASPQLAAREVSRPSSPVRSSSRSTASDRSSNPDPAPPTVVQPPAYTHGRSPSYSQNGQRSARQLEKQRVVDPPSEEEPAQDLPPLDEEAEQEQLGMSGHVATDDKAVLEARREFASRPSTASTATDGDATAPHIVLDMEGFEAQEEEELPLPEGPPPHEESPSSPFPAPPSAVQRTFTGAATSADVSAPSAPDFDFDPAEEATAPPEGDLNGDMESVIQSSAAVGWLPIYEASGSRTQRLDHASV